MNRVPPPYLVLWGGGVALACGLDGQVLAEELHGLFAGDTRVLSTYQMLVSGQSWRLLGRSHFGHGTAQWEYQNTPLRDALGEIGDGTLLLTLRRRVDQALHDDLRLQAFAQRPVKLQVTLQLDADFADLFEVKSQSLPPRVNVRRATQQNYVALSYEKEGFRRGLQINLTPAFGQPVFVGTRIVFELLLDHGAEWTCCVEARPEVDGTLFEFAGDPHQSETDPVSEARPLSIRTDPLLESPFTQGRADLHALAIPQAEHPPYIAAGVPWFLTLFGRDSLIPALMAGLDGVWSAKAALSALGPLQATERDDWRDAEPGKLLHECRRGELARRNRIPFAPAYYGAHDVPALYCLALWQAWRWSGDEQVLKDHLDAARAALHWCDKLGDRDGDGLLEYETRSSKGYRNQSWKDAEDAVVHADGKQAELPLATVELQGYLFAARLAMAELLEVVGEQAEAEHLHQTAEKLRDLVEARYWLEEKGFYAFALDGRKRQVAGISSNPGHLLWCGLPAPARAAALAERLLKPDLFSGWGLRTLSSENPAYNPLSYQRGSVWPHDTMLAAAGLWHYGHHKEASTLIRAILEAACAFEDARLPELFCGLPRSHDLPVPYAQANIPQAWAAAAPIMAAHLFLGLVPDAPHGRCFISPWLPEWLPRLEVRGVAIGDGSLEIVIVRRDTETVIEHLESQKIDVMEATVEAPLWGRTDVSRKR
ncbi:MAG TPA: glycogen debranching N-terminal domain-containing protein [Ktedonobacteraceae bacterium]|nr:glycogen debranching N-terminal domain-containing protein [Ktedonobacteraceae bacterium]